MPEKNILNPEVTLIADCHTCGEKVRFGHERCPYCGITLDYEDLFPSTLINFVIAQAVASANDIRGMDVAVYIYLGIALYIPVFGMPYWFHLANVIGWGALILLLAWFRKHGRWRIRDPEYEFVKRDLKGSLKMWLAANAFNLIVMFATWMTNFQGLMEY